MSRVFLKSLQGQRLWLGLVVPENIELRPGEKDAIPPPVSFGARPASRPGAKIRFLRVKRLDEGRPVVDWDTVDALPEPFARQAEAFAQWPLKDKQDFLQVQAEDADKEFRSRTARLAESLGTAMRLLEIFREVRRLELSTDDEAAALEAVVQGLQRAAGTDAAGLPIELYSHMLFLAQSPDNKPPFAVEADRVYADSAREEPVDLALSALQMPDRIVFDITLDRIVPRAADLFAKVKEGVPFAPYLRLVRGVGLDDRDRRDTGLLAISEATEAEKEAPFRPYDVVPPELSGELLNYQLQLLNPFGRCTHWGRLVLQRRDVRQPPPPTEAKARLFVAAEAEGLKLVNLQFTFAPAAGEWAGRVRPVAYRQQRPVVPTGFYGDADDAALTVARLLSDLDPASAVADAVADALGGERKDFVYDPAVGTYGLEPVDLVASASGAVSADLAAILPLRAVRFFCAYERADLDGAAGVADAPESPLIAMEHEIWTQGPAGEHLVAVVPHLEDVSQQLPAEAEAGWLREGMVRFVPLHDGEELPKVRAVIDHLGYCGADPESPARWAVGGYRIQVRDGADPKAPWLVEGIVQALPPLVRAYAPLEAGANWKIERREGDRVPPVEDVDDTSGRIQLPSHLAPPYEPKQGAPSSMDKAVGDLPIDPTPPARLFADIEKLRNEQASRAHEVLIPVEELRSLTPKAFPAGNWLLFKDQGGNYRGRAWFYKGRLAYSDVDRITVLQEVSSGNDAVPIDDFGHIHWDWRGLRDGWRRELELHAAPIGRYEGIEHSVRLATQQPTRTVPVPPSEGVHVLTVHRSEKPLDSIQVAATQQFNDQVDAFLFRLVAPQAQLHAVQNAPARTALGMLGFRVEELEASLAFDETLYPSVAPAVSLLDAWRKNFAPPAPAPAPDVPAQEGDLGTLLIDVPSCCKVDITIVPYADNLGGTPTRVAGAQRPRWPLREAPVGGISLDPGDLLRIVLPRLAHSYSGRFEPKWPKGTEHSLLALADPHASASLYRRIGVGPWTEIAWFWGHGIQPRAPRADEEQKQIDWGHLLVKTGLVEAARLDTSRGDLLLKPNQLSEAEFAIAWSVQGHAEAHWLHYRKGQ